MTSTSDKMFSPTNRRLKMRFIGSVGTTVAAIHAKSQDNSPRGLWEIIYPSLLHSNVPMTPSSDEIVSQTKRRLKMRFIATVGTTLGVIHAKFQEDLPRGSSEIVSPSWL